jgi:protein-tyrosine phosphatase
MMQRDSNVGAHIVRPQENSRLKETPMKKILFVCTGNTCRSPMAAVLLNKIIKEKGVDAFAFSAGLAVSTGEPASKNAVTAALELGGELSNHRASFLTQKMLEESDDVFVMSLSHKSAIERDFPQFLGKINLLGAGICDPYGGDIESYRKCRDEIEAAFEIIVEQFL